MMLEDILLNVKKPARYIGGEWNSTKKDPSKCSVSVALCFPEVYEVGMSNLGFRIIYGILNEREDILCERVFAPWPDMEEQMRKNGISLFSLESRIPLRKFDILGFSLSYELTYTNVLNMLDMAGIPLFSKQRGDSDPIVIAGGYCTVNPMPMSLFFDAILVGDGEEAVLEIAQLIKEKKAKKASRKQILEGLGALDGVYVPGLSSSKVKKRIVKDLDGAFFPTDCIVPNIEAVHDRISIEIMRGCPFRCKFCQAQIVYYPKRQRSKEKVLELAKEIYKKTGYEEISLVSLSSGSHSQIEDIICLLLENFTQKEISISLPSLRVEKYSKRLPEFFKDRRRTGITFAPEAGTKRLRDFLNKRIDEEELLKCADEIYNMGWKRIKLYFMIGLPTEQNEDLDGIVDLSYRISGLKGKNRPPELTISVGNFIPKPHTPLERSNMNRIEELARKQDYLRKKISKPTIKFDFQDPRVSTLEAILCRADEKLGRAVWRAWESGSKFDAWREHFNWDNWLNAFSAENINIENYLYRDPASQENLPWSVVDMQMPIDA